MNIAVRKAILSHKPLSKMLGKLSKFAASVKQSINLFKIHLSNKCCLRCENATRWGSSFLMLWSYIKAYNSSAFEFESCPYTLEKIELYFQILKPVYRFNLFVQKTRNLMDFLFFVVSFSGTWHHGLCALWPIRPTFPPRQLCLWTIRSRKQLGQGPLHRGS